MALTAAQDLDPRTIHLYQGVTWRGVFTWTQLDQDSATPVYVPVDVSGYSAIFTFLNKAGGTALVTVVSPDSLEGGIDIDVPNAVFTVHLSADQTALLSKDGAYELNAVSTTDPLEVERISAGFANVILTGEPWPFPVVTE